MSEKIYPICKFCGATFIPLKDMTAEEAETYALGQCDCEDAKEYRKKENNIRKLKLYIDDFENYCTSRDSKLTEEIKTIMLNSGRMIINNEIEAVNIKVSPINIKISMNSNGNIVLNFTYKDSKKTEVV